MQKKYTRQREIHQLHLLRSTSLPQELSGVEGAAPLKANR